MEGKGLDIPRGDQQGRTFHSTEFPHPQPSVTSGPQTLPSPSPSPHFYRQNLSWPRLLWAAMAKGRGVRTPGTQTRPPSGYTGCDWSRESSSPSGDPCPISLTLDLSLAPRKPHKGS